MRTLTRPESLHKEDIGSMATQTRTQTRTHSLSAAVDDGTITAERAMCGLTMMDLARLRVGHPTAEVLVRLRGPGADGRIVMMIEQLAGWLVDGGTITSEGVAWGPSEIRDVMPITQ